MKKIYKVRGSETKVYVASGKLFKKEEMKPFDTEAVVDGPGGMYYVQGKAKSVLCTKDGFVLASCMNFVDKERGICRCIYCEGKKTLNG